MVICLPFIHSVHNGHMKKVKVNENHWNRMKQTNKRKVAAFVGGATKKWGNFAVYTLETEKPRKEGYEKCSKLKTAYNDSQGRTPHNSIQQQNI